MYETIATKIIKDSIKSAIFIDEKAREPYNLINESATFEEELSANLFANFKDNGISLAVHKFNISDINNAAKKDYLFQNRDLVLLDWKLDDQTGEEYALKLLADIILRPHIHFCAIYTSHDDLTEIFSNILSYFSNSTKNEYDDLKDLLAEEEKEIQSLSSELKKLSLVRFNKDERGKIMSLLVKDHPVLIKRIYEVSEEENKICSLLKANIAFSNTEKSDKKLPSPTVISENSKLLVINNTIITILNKTERNPNDLIDKISKEVHNSHYSFSQLLGLEMQNIFSKSASFIDSEFLRISKDTLLFHRKKLKEDKDNAEYSDLIFNDIIKAILLENANLKLSSENLELLSKDLLDHLSISAITPSNDELISLNSFYNSVKLPVSNKRLNFGDIFLLDNKYYLCITALCDCLRPSKTDWLFYFVEGTIISTSNALLLGDSAFVSYVSDKKIVCWSNIDIIKGDTESEKNEFIKSFRYRPVYVTPISFLVEKPTIIDGRLNVCRIFQYSENKGDIEFKPFKYLTTIKENYTQRIANHAFTHPVRIGVDFVSK